jgi:hypothetical protein
VATDDRDRNPRHVALDELRRPCELVRGAQRLHLELVAVRVDLADVAVDRLHAGDPDRDVGLTLAPRPPERVADDHGRVDAAACEPVTDDLRRVVRVERRRTTRP